MKKFFPMSVWYGPGRVTPKLPVKTWKRDVANIKKLGFNTIRGWVNWGYVEPERGKFNFEEIDLLMDLAEKNNLKVILQTYVEYAPDWLNHRYPDARFVTESGHVISSQCSPGVCTDHPEVKKDAQNFLTSVASHVKDKPAFYGWDVWSEPHTIQWVYQPHITHAMFCYCPYTIREFREWLKQKYGTIKALNDAWSRSFNNWDMVEPPRYVVLHFARDYIDWELFCVDRLANILKWKVEALKKGAPNHVVSSHAGISSIIEGPLSGAPDDWRMAKQVDVWGTSSYPKHGSMHIDYAQMGAGMDATRSASSSRGKPFWIGEHQCGHGVAGLKLGEPVTGEDIRMWTWSIISRGAKGINYYHWYPMRWGFESTGYGMANLDGTPSSRAKSTGEMARAIDKYADLFLDGQPAKAEVAILYNILSQIMLLICFEKKTFYPTASLIGVYRALVERSIPTDFVNLDDIIEGKLKKYKLLFMPFSLMISRDVCKKVIEFVENGGTVVADARCAWNEDTGWSAEEIPGFGLSKVFGCREAWSRSRKKPEIRITEKNPAIPLLSAGDTLAGTFWEEALEVLPGGKVIAKFPDGSPAIVVNKYGKGKAVFVGTCLGMAYEKYRDVNAGKLLKGFADWVGISPPVEVSNVSEDQLIEARLLEGSGFKVLFGFNHGGKAAAPKFRIKLPTGKYAAYDIIGEKTVPCEYKEGALALTRKLAPKEVCVIRVTPKA
jgi:beta-galactosidase